VTTAASPDDSSSQRSTRLPAVWSAAIIGVLVAAVVLLIAGRGESSSATEVVLDVPGEYQQPGINTNAPLEGTDLNHALVLDLDGNELSTSDWFGADAGPTMINFWFTTCPPCRREMPALQQAYEKYGSTVRFIGVNVQDSASSIRSFADELGVTYEMVRDPNGTFVVPNGIAAFPTTLFVDSTGRIVEQVAGELTSASIDRSIARLLESPTP
jgi:thiol-disulfide isomerase/thioredoxin